MYTHKSRDLYGSSAFGRDHLDATVWTRSLGREDGKFHLDAGINGREVNRREHIWTRRI